MLRLHPPLLTNLDEWIESQTYPPSRPEAIRRLVEQALAAAKKR
jgi:metal-responsive CopG/Arc/MetJ family transcriptional regulator